MVQIQKNKRKNRPVGFKSSHRTSSPNEGKYNSSSRLWKDRSKAYLELGGTVPIKRADGTYRFVKLCVGYGKNPRCKKAAVTTDHIKNPAIHENVDFWDETNWQPMCRSCHAIKSNQERAKARKKDRY